MAAWFAYTFTCMRPPPPPEVSEAPEALLVDDVREREQRRYRPGLSPPLPRTRRSDTIREQRSRSLRGFRPEIEGLRAIAVMLVVLFHAGLPGLGGGFVGVDVF